MRITRKTHPHGPVCGMAYQPFLLCLIETNMEIEASSAIRTVFSTSEGIRDVTVFNLFHNHHLPFKSQRSDHGAGPWMIRQDLLSHSKVRTSVNVYTFT